jgi:FkbM family methyltransferase
VSEDRYRQDIEFGVLLSIFGRLKSRTVIDVGGEHGSFIRAFLDAGAEAVHAFEPFPGHMAGLREKFGADLRVKLHEIALSDHDGSATLKISTLPDGQPCDYHHSLLSFRPTTVARWDSEIPVACARIDSLIGQGLLPSRAGILKIDTEGNDFAILSCLGPCRADAILLEFWEDLPEVYGKCPYTIADLKCLLRPPAGALAPLNQEKDQDAQAMRCQRRAL